MTGPDILRALAPVVAVLERLGVPYRLGGSLVTLAHGLPRATVDADVVAELRDEHAAVLAGALGQDFYLDEGAVREAIRRRSSFNAIHLATMIKVDLFVPPDAQFDRSEQARARPHSFEVEGGLRTFVVESPEDHVLRKLRWYRDGNEVAAQQWRDVVGVLQVQAGNLDDRYLDEWAERLGVADLLAEARREAAGDPT